MTRVVFLCGHNSARSQMAEGFLRAYGGGRFLVESAGTTAGGLHPLAVRAMAEVGIDISGQRSTSVDELSGRFDVCVTVCDANCPIPPGADLQLRWELPDPALAGGSEEERLAAFRLVRDAIGDRVRALARSLPVTGAAPAAGRSTSKEDRDAAVSGPLVNPQGPLPPRPGEHLPPSAEPGQQGGQPIDQPMQPRPAPQPDAPKTM